MKRTTQTSAGSVAVNTDPLAVLRAELEKYKSKRVQVGVLGGKDARSGDESEGYVPGNAEIGLIHEFGVIGGKSPFVVPGQSKEPSKQGGRSLPERSFLRMPIISRLPLAIMKEGKQRWRDSIIRDGVVITLKRLGVMAEGLVHDAFATGGFGTWPKLSKYTIRKKGSAAILIDTAQLRQAITSRVVG